MERESDEISQHLHKYYTAFVMFAQDGLTNKTIQLHCTHKYLGVQTRTTMMSVYEVVAKYFEQPRVFPLAVFNERVDFLEIIKRDETTITESNTVSVLKSFITADNFFPDLRKELEHFRADDHAIYQPHITVQNYPDVTGHFQCYAIMSGENILQWWGNPEWNKIQNSANAKKSRLAERRKKSPLKLMG